MAYLLFFGYLIFILWAISRVSFFQKSGLPRNYLWGLFLVKVAAGVAYGYFHALRGGGDTWMYHSFGLENLQLLRSDPVRFLTSLKNPGYSTGYGEFFGTANSWWNDLDGHVFGKMLAIAHLASGSNYYINSIFFNLFSFAGTLLLVKVWDAQSGKANSFWLLAPFLVPSFIFWSSGIHKENLLVFAMGLMVYACYFGAVQQNFTLPRIAAILVGFFFVLVMRNYLLAPLGVALIALFLANKMESRIHPMMTFSGLFLLAGVFFFSIKAVAPSTDLPQVVIDRQEAFNELGSRNRFQSLPLQPDAYSFMRHAPQAFYNAAFRPMIWEANNIWSRFAAVETAFMLALWILSLSVLTSARWRNPVFLFCLFFSATTLVIIGYTVVFPGAIVRYRSILLPFMLMPSIAFLMRKYSKSLFS